MRGLGILRLSGVDRVEDGVLFRCGGRLRWAAWPLFIVPIFGVGVFGVSGGTIRNLVRKEKANSTTEALRARRGRGEESKAAKARRLLEILRCRLEFR